MIRCDRCERAERKMFKIEGIRVRDDKDAEWRPYYACGACQGELQKSREKRETVDNQPRSVFGRARA
jgi:hypothetical protein